MAEPTDPGVAHTAERSAGISAEISRNHPGALAAPPRTGRVGPPGAALIDIAWRLARPLLFRQDAEQAHHQTLERVARRPALAAALLRRLCAAPALPREVGGLRWAGPVGLAAGLDKDAVALPIWEAMGFGAIEVGTVTPLPQAGNPTPRLFRLPAERAIINRMGFNNAGVGAMRARLGAWRDAGLWPRVPVGANIGKNKDTPNDAAEGDYLRCVLALTSLVDSFTVNVSSPNTPDLRALQEPARLQRLLDAVVSAARPRPVFLKLAPDLGPGALAEAVDVAAISGCAGVITGNTTITRPGETGRTGESGGLSGGPLYPLARAQIAVALKAADGRLPVIGVGGISSPEAAAELLDLGCAALQVYTGLIYEGPGLPARLHRALAAR